MEVFIDCVQNGLIHNFPVKKKRCEMKIKQILPVNVYCVCERPSFGCYVYVKMVP